MKVTKLSAEELAEWVTPEQALATAKAALGKEGLAANTIVARLRDGLMTAGAHTVVIWDDGEEERLSNVTVEASRWNALPGGAFGHDLWTNAQLELWTDHGSTRTTFYGLRIDPAGLSEWQRAFPTTADVTPPASSEAPPVASAHLARWYEAYLEVFTEAQQSEDHAWASASGMFPGKSVTRRAIRDLRRSGTLKRGRKPKGTEA